jgi:hypothetical protein
MAGSPLADEEHARPTSIAALPWIAAKPEPTDER